MTTDTPSSPLPAGAPDWEALARYVSDESPAAEADAIALWLRDHPDGEAVLRAIDGACALAGTPAEGGAADIDVESALRRAIAERDRAALVAPARTSSAPDIRPLIVARPWRAYALRAAAVVIVLGAAALAWQQLRGGGGDGTGAPRTVATAAGQRAETFLPDSSRVVLGPGSTLTIAARYGEADRSVVLAGEALFDVRHDAAHPFVVQAGDTEIRDVGTVFVVHSDTNDVRVAVTAGAVRLRIASVAGDTGVVLGPGDRRVVEHGRDATAGATTVTAQDTAWTHGLLVFRDAPFSELRAEMRRWYGIDLQLRDTARVRDGFNAAFSSEPVDVVLRAIELANPGTRIERDGRVALVRSR
ncbi:MAG: FecR domain-containing protein [Gemmatimonadaceae bacterium]